MFDTPLLLHYPAVDPVARYKIRVVYSGDARDVLVRLTSGTTEIHPLIQKLYPPKPMEFDVPHEVTSTGAVTSS